MCSTFLVNITVDDVQSVLTSYKVPGMNFVVSHCRLLIFEAEIKHMLSICLTNGSTHGRGAANILRF